MLIRISFSSNQMTLAQRLKGHLRVRFIIYVLGRIYFFANFKLERGQKLASNSKLQSLKFVTCIEWAYIDGIWFYNLQTFNPNCLSLVKGPMNIRNWSELIIKKEQHWTDNVSIWLKESRKKVVLSFLFSFSHEFMSLGKGP